MASYDEEPLLPQEAALLNETEEVTERRYPIQKRRNGHRLRKLILFMTIGICALLMMIYWTQSPARKTEDLQFMPDAHQGLNTPETHKHNDTSYSGLDAYFAPITNKSLNIFSDKFPQWTWACKDKVCEREQATETSQLQSLATCNMFCGEPQIWPKPTGTLRLSTKTVPVWSTNFQLRITKTPSDKVTEYLKGTFDLFKQDLRKIENQLNESLSLSAKKPLDVLVHISVQKDANPRLTLYTDESYKLAIKSESTSIIVSIESQSFCGARNGLETLSQLTWAEPYAGSLLMPDAATIEDAPAFIYRGILLDTARNFFPVDDLFRTIDAMAANKLNTFHWHATDSQSFPLMLDSAPQLAQYGAYGPAAVYTPDDIKTVVHRAALRGIRVVIEIDAPAHVGSAFWNFESDDKLAYCVEELPWKSYCGEPPCGQLNPKNTKVYEMLEQMYKEIIELTGVTDVFHLGSDEVNAGCWNKYIRGEDTMELWLDFLEKSHDALVRANGGTAPELTMIWSSRLTQAPYLQKIDKNKFTIQLWGSSQWPEQVAILNAGFRAVLSHVNAWYFDCGLGSWRNNGDSHCGPYARLKQVYNHRPWGKSKEWQIVGGAAASWAEMLSSEGVDGRLWPRGAALAERLWADPADLSDSAATRLDSQRSRLVTLGTRANPLWSTWCTQNANKCYLSS